MAISAMMCDSPRKRMSRFSVERANPDKGDFPVSRRDNHVTFRRVLELCLLLPIVTTLLYAQEASSTSIEGLWGAETRLGLPVSGTLTLDGTSDNWKATIAGYEVPVTRDGIRLGFSLPHHRGSFRGRFDIASHFLQGEWIQPGGLLLDARYATPLHFNLASAGIWRAEVVPLEERLSVYVLISAGNGALRAVVSNPEANLFRRRVYVVTQDGNHITFEANGKRFEGVYDKLAGTLTTQLVDWLPAFTLTRRDADDAAGFYPRVPSARQHWTYAAPIDGHDGWSVSTLAHQGVDREPIAKLINRILQADPTDSSLRIQSLLIARHGHLLLEEYFYGFSQDRVHDMRSAGKTFAPVLVGLARAQGSKLGPTTPVYRHFGELPLKNRDARKERMTLLDLMTMTAGNACDDNDDASPGNEDRMQSDGQKMDWYSYTLDLPMLKEPGGENAIYCSGDLNLVGGVVAAASHVWLPEFFQDRLAQPLQFSRYYLNLMPNGEAYMGGGAYVEPRDQLKLGQLYLSGGVWNGKRLVGVDWVRDSTVLHARFSPESSLGQEHGYGFGWHLHTLKSGGKAYKVFAAEGNGGQFILVVPALDMVIGITGGAYGEFSQWYKWELELVPQFIIPSVKRDHRSAPR